MSLVTKRVLAGVGAGALALSVGVAAPAAGAKGGGNIACPAGTTVLKLDRAPVEGEELTDGTLTVMITETKKKLDGSGEVYGFYASFSGGTIVRVIVKGGPDANQFYRDDVLFATQKLGTPSGTHYEISNVQFCYTASLPG